MRPYYSHSSRENATTSGSTSLLASCKGVPPTPGLLDVNGSKELYYTTFQFGCKDERVKNRGETNFRSFSMHRNPLCSRQLHKLETPTFTQLSHKLGALKMAISLMIQKCFTIKAHGSITHNNNNNLI